MTKRTYENSSSLVEIANDLENLVFDKRSCWRADTSKSIRRQRRYKKRIVNQLYIINKV